MCIQFCLQWISNVHQIPNEENKRKKKQLPLYYLNIAKLMMLIKALNLSIMWRKRLVGNERLTWSTCLHEWQGALLQNNQSIKEYTGKNSSC